jgi:hypothetical protein
MTSFFPEPPQQAGSATRLPNKYERCFYAAARVSLSLLVVWIFVRAAWGIYSFRKWQYVENRDPAEVFQMVFKTSPPSGVLDIKAAGYQPFNGSLWMCIRTRDMDGLLKALKTTDKSISDVTSDGSEMENYKPQGKEEQRYAAKAEWDSAHHVKQSEYYTFPRKFTGVGWVGVLVVDRNRHRVYVSTVVL